MASLQSQINEEMIETLQNRVDSINDSYFASYPPSRVILDNYNIMMEVTLPEAIQNMDTTFVDVNGVQCFYKFVDVETDFKKLPNGNPAFPMHARRGKTDHVCVRKCTLEIWRKFADDTEFVRDYVNNDFSLWSEPVMAGSIYCPLSRVSKELPKGIERRWLDVDDAGNPTAFEDRDYSFTNVQSWASVDEDPNIPPGWFICDGQRKAVTTQEAVALNTTFRVIDKKLSTFEFKTGGDMVVDIRSVGTNHAISHIKVVLAKKVREAIINVNGKKINHVYFVSCISMPSLNKTITNVINAIRLMLYFDENNTGEDTLEFAIDYFNSYFDKATSLSGHEQNMGVGSFKQYTIEDAKLVGNDQELINLYARISTKPGAQYRKDETNADVQINPTEAEIATLGNIFHAQFFPHIPTDNINSKLTVLLDMVVDSIKFKLGYVSLSNKDHYGIKNLRDPAILILIQDLDFLNSYLVSKIREKPPAVSIRDDVSDDRYMGRQSVMSTRRGNRNSHSLGELVTSIKNKITKIGIELHKNFVVGKWGVPSKKTNTNVLQTISQTTISSVVNTLRRIGVNVEKNASPEKSRQLDPSQYGYVDPTDTPDSDSGHVKQMSNTMRITTEESDENIISWLLDDTNPKVTDDREWLPKENRYNFEQVGVYVNGNFVGYTADGRRLEREMLAMRRTGTFLPSTAIYLRPDFDSHEVVNRLIITTSAGRAIRPLFVVDDGTKLAFLGLTPPTNNFDELVLNGAIVWVDPSESEWRRIAVKLSDLTTDNKFDLMEMDPQNIFGVVASMMQLANYNSMPRIAYNANMMKQFASTVNMGFHNDFETGTKVLRYGQKSFVPTKMGTIMKQQEQPSEQNAVIAIMTHNYAIEDALVIKASSLQRGLITSDSYDIVGFDVDPNEGEKLGGKSLPEGLVPTRNRGTYTYQKNVTELQSERPPLTAEEREELQGELSRETNPEKVKELMRRATNTQNIIGVATYRTATGPETMQEYQVQKGDIIACKTTIEGKKTSEKCINMHGLKGVVDKVWINYNPTKDKTFYRIRLRSININGNWKDIGDKLFGGHSQKGVIGLVVPDEDMPFTPDGISPDIIFNPHGFPSRVTMGYHLDALFGLAASTQDVNFARELAALPLPVQIKGTSVLSDAHGKMYADLDAKHQKAVAALGHLEKKRENKPTITEAIKTGQDFPIPDWMADLRYPPAIVTIGDLDSKLGVWYRLAYEAINGNLPRSSNYGRTTFNGTPYRGELLGKNQKSEEYIARELLIAKGWASIVPGHLDEKTKRPILENGNTGTTIMTSGKTGRIIGNYRVLDEATQRVQAKLDWADEGDLTEEEREKAEIEELEAQRTGKDLQFEPTQFQIGIMSYKPLKHVVKEKIRYRDVGPNSFLTRQAIKGKSKEGGIRFGEQETQIFFAHGASALLQDRFHLTTDPSSSVSCSRCYQTAYLEKGLNLYKCTACGDAAQFVQLDAPRSLELLRIYLNAMGLKSIFRYGNTEDSVAVTRRIMDRAETNNTNK